MPRHRTALPVLMILAALSATGAFATTNPVGPGCINCVNNGGTWGCSLTQSNGGTNCTIVDGACGISGDCRIPVNQNPITDSSVKGLAPKFLLHIETPFLGGVASGDEKLAISLFAASQFGPVESPFYIYWTRSTIDHVAVTRAIGSKSVQRYLDAPDGAGDEIVGHKITISRDNQRGELYIKIEELDHKTRNLKPAGRSLVLPVSVESGKDDIWHLTPTSWRMEALQMPEP